MHVNLENLADAQSIADNLALLPKEALLYIAGYAEGRRDRPARKRKKKDSTNGENDDQSHPMELTPFPAPAPDGAGKEVSGVKIIIEADSKEIADLVLTLQGQQNQDEIAKNYAIDIFGNKYLNYESGGRGCSNG